VCFYCLSKGRSGKTQTFHDYHDPVHYSHVAQGLHEVAEAFDAAYRVNEPESPREISDTD